MDQRISLITLGVADTGDVVHTRQRCGRQAGMIEGGIVTGRRMLDDDVDTGVDGLEDAVERCAHRVGEDHRSRHEGHAQHDRRSGENEPHELGAHAAQ